MARSVRSQSRRCARSRFRRFFVEQLEDRSLLASVPWDEAVNGDFSNGSSNLQILPLSAGLNEVRGNIGVLAFGSTDSDSFAIQVPAGGQLTSITFSATRTSGTLTSIGWGIRNGTTTNSSSPVLVSNQVISVPATDRALFSSILPLGPGQYRIFDAQFTNAIGVYPSLADYTFTFNVSGSVSGPPVIISNSGGDAASIGVIENTTAVTDVDATDPDAGSTLTYSINGGADAAKFAINSTTGVLAFATPPDFENPTDVGSDNVYDVMVQVSDGFLTATQAIAVTVTDVAESCTTVVNTNDSGAGSLREAIICANNTPGTDTIRFNIPGSGVKTISPAPELPRITDSVIIDGYTQPGASANTNSMPLGSDALGSNAVLLVQISATIPGTIGLNIDADNTIVRGLVMNGFGVQIEVNELNPLGHSGVVIEGNFLGVNPAGTAAVGTSVIGVVFPANSTNGRVGGTTPAARNVIAGFTQSGIRMEQTSDIAVQGNFVGTNAAGTAAIGKGTYGVLLVTTQGNNLIGGVDPGAGNLISGSDQGISSLNGPAGFPTGADRIQGNFVGTNARGTAGIPNRYGVRVTGSAGGLIGGDDAADGGVDGLVRARNLISGNDELGIWVAGSGFTIQGNFIGTDSSGLLPLGNGGSGIDSLSAFDNVLIGGTTPLAGNTIAFNGLVRGGDGIGVPNGMPGGIRNKIVGNSIYANAELGIDLRKSVFDSAPGVTLNDAGDADDGANKLQNYPEMSAANASGGTLTVSYVVPATTGNSAYPLRVEFFKADGDGQEGQTFLGFDTYASVEAATIKTVSLSVASAVAAGDKIVATATDNAGNTSEFSANQTVQSGGPQNSPPVISSNGGNQTASVNVQENSTVVTDVDATDPDAGSTLAYSINGGVDAAKFAINSVSGVLTFINAPDFENPTDSGGNNVYDVVVQSSDGSSADTQALAVTVTDIAEGCIVSNTNDSGAGSLREAINCANSKPGADTITFSGVFLDTTADVIKLTSGELIVSSDLTVQGPGASLLKLSGNNASRVLRVAAGTTVTVVGLTVADGNGVGGGIGPHGGGIYNEGTLTLRNVMVSQNRTRGIGGSQDNGGGIQNINGTLMLIDSTVDNNFAYGTGGGINNKQGTVNLVSSTVSNNSCASGAGGIGNFSGGIFTIINSTISGNSSGLFGGGIANSSGTLVVTNATITGNSSYNDYGGLYEFSSTTTLRNSIVAGNYKGGSGRPVFPSDIGGTITVASNNLIGDAGTSGNILHDADGNPATGSNNIVGNNGTGTILLSTIIGPLADNGGPTKTHDLIPLSPAIDRGSNTLAKDAQNQPLTTDQRGVGFAHIVNIVVDIGASEFVPAPIGPPNAVDDSYSITEDTVLTVPAPGVLGNDIRSDSGTLTAVLDNVARHGTVNLNLTSGSFSYSPDPDFSGTDSFTYHVTDGSKSSGKATVTITVTPVNDPSSGTNKAVSTLEKTSYEFVTNDFFPSDFRDVPANSLQAVRIASLPTSGNLVHNGVPVVVGQFIPALGIASGGLRYAPPVNGVGNALASFTFQVQDDGGTANGGVDLDPTPNTITINVLPVNEAPVAVDDTLNAAEDSPLSIPAPGILANDNDSDGGDTKTVVAVNAPAASGGLLWDETVSGDLPSIFGEPPVLTLQPGANEVRGTTGQPATGSADFDRFVIHVPDGAQLTSVTWAFSRTVGAVELVSWDVYAGATRLTTDSIILPANEVFDGLALPLGPGQYLFRESSITQASGVVPSLGEYTFRFQLSRESSVGVPLTLASGAQVTVNADGSFVYDPNGQFESLGAGQTANDSFTYTMADREGSESSATVAITIRGANDAPTAVSDEATVGENVALDVQAPGVLANDLDVDIGETTTVVAVNGQIASVGAALTLMSGALLTVQADGTYRYDTNGKFEFLAAGQSTTDSFVYTMADLQGSTSAATVTITIQGVNDAPVAGGDGAQVGEDGVLEVATGIGVLANDMDADIGDTKTVVAVNGVAANLGAALTLPSGATLLLRADGSYRYEPNGKFEPLAAGQTATESFTYKVVDDAGETSTGTVTITILGQNDAPVARDDAFETRGEETRTILKSEYLANDSDVDSSELTGAVVDQPGHGSVSLRLDGSFVYTPVSGFSGLDKFTYRVSDGLASSNVATISLNVAAVDHQPVVVLGGDVSLGEGQFFLVNGSFSDPDSGESWTARVNYGDGSGEHPLVLQANKTFQLGHTYTENGNYPVTVSVRDSSGLSGGATLQAIVINVAPQNVAWSGPLLATRGQSLKFAGGFSDPGPADTQVATVNWGDRSSGAATVTKTGGAWQVDATHKYASGGIFQAVLTVTDDDGGVATQATTVMIVGARINGNTIELVGSAQRDNIKLSIKGNSLLVSGSLGSAKIASAFPLAGVQTIVVYLGGGNDTLTVDAKVKFSLLVNAGGGNDVIQAGGGAAMLIGGLGQDQLTGGGKSDLLIAGTTAYDNRPAALAAILAEWISGRPLATRMENLRDGAGPVLDGLNLVLKPKETVFDDTAVDKLLGGGDLDWYWSDLKKDKISGKAAGEAVN